MLKYQSHINIEYCVGGSSIKYLFKYITKGSDRAGVIFVDSQNLDEITRHMDCRHVSACEAIWRIFEYPLHYRIPSVERLPFHLEDEQTVPFKDGDFMPDVVDKPSVMHSKFLQLFELNK